MNFISEHPCNDLSSLSRQSHPSTTSILHRAWWNSFESSTHLSHVRMFDIYVHLIQRSARCAEEASRVWTCFFHVESRCSTKEPQDEHYISVCCNSEEALNSSFLWHVLLVLLSTNRKNSSVKWIMLSVGGKTKREISGQMVMVSQSYVMEVVLQTEMY